MENIFLIHSNLTYLSSIAVIRKKHIKTPTILFWKSFKTDLLFDDFKYIILPKSLEKLSSIPSNGDKFLFFKFFFNLIKFKFFFSKNFNKKYTLFLPHNKNFLMQLFLMNKKCEKFYLIEDGLLSYNSINKILLPKISTKNNLIRSFFKCLNYSSRYKEIKSSYKGRFLFVKTDSDESIFELRIPQITKLDINFNDSVLIVLDPINNTNFFGFSSAEYFKNIENIIPKIKHKLLHISFHPSENQQEKNKFTLLLKNNNLKFNILKDDMIIEQLLLEEKKIIVFGGWSSILLYSGFLGHKTYSYISLFSDNVFIRRKLPDVFYKNVKIINY